MLKAHSLHRDKVIDSCFVSCETNYEFAMDKVVPLIEKLEIQRKVQNRKFYERLGDDICNGCIMPPLTMAFIDDNINFNQNNEIEDSERYINENIEKGFVLDGIQRLNTLKNVYSRNKFDAKRPIFFNILICPSHDKLLYRMITLNNGQKPMSARHQIEVLLGNTYSYHDENILIISEKAAGNKKIRGSFKKANFINAYLAFLSDSTSIDNKKIIEERLDELLATRIIEKGVTSVNFEFSEVIKLVGEFSTYEAARKWFQNENNLIGFAVGIRHSYDRIAAMDSETFVDVIKLFELAFENADVSKIKVGNYRRRCVHTYFMYLSNILDNDMEPVEALSYILDRID